MVKHQAILLKHPSGDTSEIKIGFSWFGFFSGPFWTLANGLWLHSFILIAVLVPLNIFADYTEQMDSSFLDLIAMALFTTYMYSCGRFANGWLYAHMLKLGYMPAITQNLAENA